MTHLTLRQSILDFVNLDLTEALDFQQVAAGGCVHRGDGVVAIGLELRDVSRTNAMGLDGIDVDNVAVLQLKSVKTLRIGDMSLTSLLDSSLATEEGILGSMRRKLLYTRREGTTNEDEKFRSREAVEDRWSGALRHVVT